MHFDSSVPMPLASFASAAWHIEAEPSRGVTAKLGVWQLCKQHSDEFKDPRISCRIRSWRIAQRLLIDAYYLIDVFNATYLIVSSRKGRRPVERLCEGFEQHILDQSAFAGFVSTTNQSDSRRKLQALVTMKPYVL